MRSPVVFVQGTQYWGVLGGRWGGRRAGERRWVDGERVGFGGGQPESRPKRGGLGGDRGLMAPPEAVGAAGVRESCVGLAASG